jgi:hypothetical protein
MCTLSSTEKGCVTLCPLQKQFAAILICVSLALAKGRHSLLSIVRTNKRTNKRSITKQKKQQAQGATSTCGTHHAERTMRNAHG